MQPGRSLPGEDRLGLEASRFIAEQFSAAPQNVDFITFGRARQLIG